MMDKRFQANYLGDCLVSVLDKQNHRTINIVQMVGLLNELNEENERLKKENNELKGSIINSLKKSRAVKCTCNPCVAEAAVLETLIGDKK